MYSMTYYLICASINDLILLSNVCQPSISVMEIGGSPTSVKSGDAGESESVDQIQPAVTTSQSRTSFIAADALEPSVSKCTTGGHAKGELESEASAETPLKSSSEITMEYYLVEYDIKECSVLLTDCMSPNKNPASSPVKSTYGRNIRIPVRLNL